MRKYLKPALEMEAFDVEDVITVSGREIIIDDSEIDITSLGAPDIDFN